MASKLHGYAFEYVLEFSNSCMLGLRLKARLPNLLFNLDLGIPKKCLQMEVRCSMVNLREQGKLILDCLF